MDLVSIGEFARWSRLSPKALRRYAELDLLRPTRVDPGSGYRWYAPGQVEQARRIALLRQIGMPLAQIKTLADLDAGVVAERVAAYWTAAEAEHCARRDLAAYLVNRLEGKGTIMYEVTIREISARSLISFRCHVNADRFKQLGKGFTRRLLDAEIPRPAGVTGAPFVVFHGSVDEDGDGPVEWCWPVPDRQADRAAATFPDLSLRTEAAHQEAYLHIETPGIDYPQMTTALNEVLLTWVEQEHREAAGDVRLVLSPIPPAPGERPGCDWGIPLR